MLIVENGDIGIRHKWFMPLLRDNHTGMGKDNQPAAYRPRIVETGMTGWAVEGANGELVTAIMDDVGTGGSRGGW